MHTRPSTLPLGTPPLPQGFSPNPASHEHQDNVYRAYHSHSSGLRINTDAFLVEKIRQQYPALHLSIANPYSCNLLAYAATGNAIATPVDSEDGVTAENLKHREYAPPLRRLDGDTGVLYDDVQFGKYLYKWEGKEYIIYSVVGADGLYASKMIYLLGGSAVENDELIIATCKWGNNPHNTVLVFDGGYWQQSGELWRSVQSAEWKDVILEQGMKRSIVGEVDKFFGSREKYQKLKVPWKRGIIFHGPPGNGKTVSIKATMHTLYSRPEPIPTLYVRSLTSFQGPEFSLRSIFGKARQQAPCLLVFEDLDSIVTDAVRSYFLNEVDGLRANDGILMVGSTNHLDRLDPGISKRPSRFDRKYLFPDPNMGQRIQYCEYWRTKLLDNEDVKFPVVLDKAIASITNGFSFAYIQEAFVAALLAIANAGEDDSDTDLEPDGKNSRIDNGDRNTFVNSGCGLTWDRKVPLWEDQCRCGKSHFECWMLFDGLAVGEDLEKYVLWREIKKIIRTLREELEQEKDGLRSGLRGECGAWTI